MSRFFHQRYSYLFFALSLGFLSTMSQVVLLRELLTVFYGNETAYAVIFASWLFWIAVGSFAASRWLQRRKDPLGFFADVQIFLFALAPGLVIAVRCLKSVMNIHIGEIIGIIPMGGMTFGILAPLTFLLGATYTAICYLPMVRQKKAEGVTDVGNIYFLESLGSACAGTVFSFWLVNLIPALHIMVLVAVLHLMVVGLFLRRKPLLKGIMAGLVMIFLFLTATGRVTRVDGWSRRQQWKGFHLVAVENSIYGNIAITRLGPEYSLYENGLLSFSTRDSLASEELVHYTLLMHPAPERVLLIGNGLDGSLQELLKYERVTVDHVQLDPRIMTLAKQYLPEGHTRVLKHSRVNALYKDARFYTKTTSRQYDAVIVNLSDPFTAVINRYYSLEFFQEVRDILKKGGMLSLSVSSSENYLSEENRAYLRSIHHTLRQVFPEVKSIPGDMNIFLAGRESGIIQRDPEFLIRQIKEKKIQPRYVNAQYIPYKLSADRLAYIDAVYKKAGRINSDKKPIAYLFDIMLWSTHFNQTYQSIIAKLLWIDIKHLLLIPLVLAAGGIMLSRQDLRAPVSVSIITTGFSEIVFQVIVILSFQTLYGYAYYRIGLIIAAFMFGLVAGSWQAKERLKVATSSQVAALYQKIQLGIAVYPLILIGAYFLFEGHKPFFFMQHFFSLIYALLPFIAGLMGGMQYPLAIRLLSVAPGRTTRLSTLAGRLYAADIAGASMGAIVSAALLIPLVGIHGMAVFMAALNLAVFVWLLFVRKKSAIVL